MLAPSVTLPDNYTDLRFDAVYPTSITPDKPVDAHTLMGVHRSYYHGTSSSQHCDGRRCDIARQPVSSAQSASSRSLPVPLVPSS